MDKDMFEDSMEPLKVREVPSVSEGIKGSLDWVRSQAMKALKGRFIDAFVREVFPDTLIVEDFVEGKLYEFDWEEDGEEVALDNEREVHLQYVALKRREEEEEELSEDEEKLERLGDLTGPVVHKNAAKQLITTVVLVPGESDGEDPGIPADKVEEVAHEWMADWRLMDYEHSAALGGDEGLSAIPVESYLTREARNVTALDGTLLSLPKGTWEITSKVRDDLWPEVEAGNIGGASIMGVSREEYRTLEAATKSAEEFGQEFQKKIKRVPLSLLGDWFCPVVSLVRRGQVPKAKIIAMKAALPEEEQQEEEGAEKSENPSFWERLFGSGGTVQKSKAPPFGKKSEDKKGEPEGTVAAASAALSEAESHWATAVKKKSAKDATAAAGHLGTAATALGKVASKKSGDSSKAAKAAQSAASSLKGSIEKLSKTSPEKWASKEVDAIGSAFSTLKSTVSDLEGGKKAPPFGKGKAATKHKSHNQQTHGKRNSSGGGDSKSEGKYSAAKKKRAAFNARTLETDAERGYPYGGPAEPVEVWKDISGEFPEVKPDIDEAIDAVEKQLRSSAFQTPLKRAAAKLKEIAESEDAALKHVWSEESEDDNEGEMMSGMTEEERTEFFNEMGRGLVAALKEARVIDVPEPEPVETEEQRRKREVREEATEMLKELGILNEDGEKVEKTEKIVEREKETEVEVEREGHGNEHPKADPNDLEADQEEEQQEGEEAASSNDGVDALSENERLELETLRLRDDSIRQLLANADTELSEAAMKALFPDADDDEEAAEPEGASAASSVASRGPGRSRARDMASVSGVQASAQKSNTLPTRDGAGRRLDKPFARGNTTL